MTDFLNHIFDTFTGREHEIIGLWERRGDTFEGCTILINENEDGRLSGTITRLPKAMTKFGWMTGDLKWRRIHRIRRNQYALEDLFKEVNPETGALRDYKYRPAEIRLSGHNRLTLRTRANASTPFSTQHWQKIGRPSRTAD